MTPAQQQAFLDASGIQASELNEYLRLGLGLLIIVVSVFILVGLLKLIEDGHMENRLRFLIYLSTLSVVLMLFFGFVVS